MNKKEWLKAITRILELRQILSEEESKRVKIELENMK